MIDNFKGAQGSPQIHVHRNILYKVQEKLYQMPNLKDLQGSPCLLGILFPWTHRDIIY